MSTLKAQPGFLDLTQQQRPSEVDLYLSAENIFYFGTSSGPLSVAFQSGKPYLLIDVFPFATARQNGVNSIMDFYDKSTGNLLSFETLKSMDLDLIFSNDVFRRAGIEHRYADENKILDSVKEMLSFHAKCDLVKENEAVAKRKAELGIHESVMFTSSSLERCM